MKLKDLYFDIMLELDEGILSIREISRLFEVSLEFVLEIMGDMLDMLYYKEEA
jgi:hypothetical protein